MVPKLSNLFNVFCAQGEGDVVRRAVGRESARVELEDVVGVAGVLAFGGLELGSEKGDEEGQEEDEVP